MTPWAGHLSSRTFMNATSRRYTALGKLCRSLRRVDAQVYEKLSRACKTCWKEISAVHKGSCVWCSTKPYWACIVDCMVKVDFKTIAIPSWHSTVFSLHMSHVHYDVPDERSATCNRKMSIIEFIKLPILAEAPSVPHCYLCKL